MAWGSACRWGGRRGVPWPPRRARVGLRRDRRPGLQRRAGRCLAGVTDECIQPTSFPAAASPEARLCKNELSRQPQRRAPSTNSVTDTGRSSGNIWYSVVKRGPSISTPARAADRSKTDSTHSLRDADTDLCPPRAALRERPRYKAAARKRRDLRVYQPRHRYTASRSYAPEAPLCSRRAGDRPRSVRRDGEDVKTRSVPCEIKL